MAQDNYAALSGVRTKELNVCGIPYKVQFNPARIVSSGAKVDARSIKQRKCFLCPENLPPMQQGIPFGGHYQILVNPFPIFPRHLTIPETAHVPQRIAARFGHMLDLAQALPDYTVFYNGPRCGASAPDHAHFQAGSRGFMPIEKDWRGQVADKIACYKNAVLWHLDDAPRNTLVIQSPSKDAAEELFGIICRALPMMPGQEEPMMNLLAAHEAGQWTVFVFARAKHRPACYAAEGDANLLSSPASVDLGGVFILPVEKDFVKITAEDIAGILGEVCLSAAESAQLRQRIRQQIQTLATSPQDSRAKDNTAKGGGMENRRAEEPEVRVGIMSGTRIEFSFPTPYRLHKHCREDASSTPILPEEVQAVTSGNGKVLWNNREFDELEFSPADESTGCFELRNVTIGINFHWERQENQRFRGSLKFIAEDGKLTAVNVIRVEDYLTSVISSEMSATASLELLKAHAVISRSWLLAQIQKDKETAHAQTACPTPSQSGEEFIRWYDREDHTRFDVCADDHCQRYQGITRASTEIVKQAIAATRGQVLTYGGKICDARFSKCCGGAFEEFQYCWEDVKHPYLLKQRDFRLPHSQAAGSAAEAASPCNDLPDLTQEAEAARWIRTSPQAFCNTADKQILAQVLNNYDRETTDFYRWRVEYTQEELSALILKRSGIDYGQIIDLVPMARGTSGRLWKLKIVGTKKTLVIGKELEIRRILSASHLYSSAFVTDKEGSLPIDKDAPQGCGVQTVPARFILTGAGWGHGVGLCQIGAAVMGERGYKYDAILLHYYVGASIDRLYE